MTNVYIPDSEASAAALVRDAASRRGTLIIRGGGTRWQHGIGQPHEVLSSIGLVGIVQYNPAEMVMTALPGTPVATIKAALAENNQMMAWEPMDHRKLLGTTGEPTIGGIFGANVSGPRRFAAGASRDHLLGVRFLNGRAEAIKAGGRVMKNVTGLDLAKLLVGSFGTLGFMTEVTFKVLPKPKATHTLCIEGLSDAQGNALMAKAMATPLEINGAAHLSFGLRFGAFGGESVTALRIEGPEASVQTRIARLADICRDAGPQRILEEDNSRAFWRGIRDVEAFADQSDTVVWKVSVEPTEGARFVARVRQTMQADAFYDWQGGLVWLRLPGEADATAIRSLLASKGSHATLVRASREIVGHVPRHQPSDQATRIIAGRVKQKFDPAGIFGGPAALGA
ncbi:FAD-binding protein [Rhizobium sp.]